jgi:hypothetical protein
MKKVMLFIVSMLFAVSASAATLQLTADGGNIGQVSPTTTSQQNVGASTIESGFFSGDVHDAFSLDVADGMAWATLQFAHFFSADSATFTVKDGSGATVISGPMDNSLVHTMISSANSAYTILIDIVGAGSNSVYAFTVATPIPAALFLFAPALLGFLGLRRRATALAA